MRRWRRRLRAWRLGTRRHRARRRRRRRRWRWRTRRWRRRRRRWARRRRGRRRRRRARRRRREHQGGHRLHPAGSTAREVHSEAAVVHADGPRAVQPGAAGAAGGGSALAERADRIADARKSRGRRRNRRRSGGRAAAQRAVILRRRGGLQQRPAAHLRATGRERCKAECDERRERTSREPPASAEIARLPMRSASSVSRVARSARAVKTCFCILARRRCGSTAAELPAAGHSVSSATLRRQEAAGEAAGAMLQRRSNTRCAQARGRCGTHRRARHALKAEDSTQAGASSSEALGAPGGCSALTSGARVRAHAAVERRRLEASVCSTRRLTHGRRRTSTASMTSAKRCAEAQTSHGIRARVRLRTAPRSEAPAASMLARARLSSMVPLSSAVKK